MIRLCVSSIARRARRLLGLGLPPRHQNDYATHLPILVGIGSVLQVKRILEFGSGFYSTLTFLNRLAFPDVVLVESIESDAEWMSRISVAAKGDPRLQIRYIPEPIERVLSELPLDTYDLVLVDSSTEANRRASLIQELAERNDLRGMVAIHDFEVSQYRGAAKNFRNLVDYTAYNPCTGILWQTEDEPTRALRQMSKVIDRFSKRFQPDDLQAWSEIFHKHRSLIAANN